jgi:hypothetical protein
MKSSAILKAVYKDCLDRGYILIGDQLFPPGHLAALAVVKPKRKPKTVHHKTGWIDDTRNIKNRAEQKDIFMMLLEKEGFDVWPEFFFSTERLYRFDYALPFLNSTNSTMLKIAIECDGGTWSQGKSGHSSGTGLERDRNKNNLALANGWVIIRRTPDQMCTIETIELIKNVIKQRLNASSTLASQPDRLPDIQ